MFKIIPIRAFTDNYIWLLQSENSTICVDPGDATPVLAFLKQQNRSLDTILITHHHHDHTDGIAALRHTYPHCNVYGPEDCRNLSHTIQAPESIQTSIGTIDVWNISGHTRHHLGYLIKQHFFCGDILFSGGCGRVFDGDIHNLFDSMQKINTLPEDTLLYPAHEYTLSNLKFALSLEKNNPNVQAALAVAKTRTQTLPTTLKHERLINPFLRTKEPNFIQHLKDRYPTETPLTLFVALREAKNRF